MALINMPGSADINDGVKEFEGTEGAVLLDVRTADEYAEGHIPGSINIPLDTIRAIETAVPDKTLPVFLHCLSGARSAQAERIVKQLGYANAQNIGGFNAYRGMVEV